MVPGGGWVQQGAGAGVQQRAVRVAPHIASPLSLELPTDLREVSQCPCHHDRPGSPLAPSLASWLDAGQDPVIFMSMGSIYQVQDHVLDLFQQVTYSKLLYYSRSSYIRI